MFQLFQNPKGKDHQSTSIGLGLSYCKAVIEKMNGKISFKSTPGVGTTVAFTILAVHNENDEGLTKSQELSHQNKLCHFNENQLPPA